MSTPGNYITVDDNSNSFCYDKKYVMTEPLLKKEISNLKDRNIENFLNHHIDKVPGDNEEDLDHDSITINEDIRSISTMSSLNERNEKVEIVDIPLPVDITHESTFGFKMNAESEHSERSSNIKDETKIDYDYTIPTMNVHDNIQYVATPTITSRQIPLKDFGRSGDELQQNPSEFQIFTDQLNKLSATIQQKDEEIQKLSNKVFELESKAVKSIDKLINKSSKSSSSSSDESVTISHKIKEKKISEKKPMDTKKSKKDGNLKKNNEIDSKSDVVLKKEETKDNISNESLPKTEHCDVENDEEMIPDLRHKLNELEAEVKRLKQANIESLTSIQSIQRNTPLSHEQTSNVAIINQLLVDYSLLKEELVQLKWEHTKLAQPSILSEELRELKIDVDALRTQNELLHQYVKSPSTNSLNKLSNVSKRSWEDVNHNVKEHRKEKKKTNNGNNSSDYIYENLYSRKRMSSGTPNVSTMLKHSIESLESPYHASCQFIQNAIPYSGGKTYRARKLSDSSSALVEDVTPKIWLEPDEKNCKPRYSDFSKYNEPTPLIREYDKCDDGSVDSTTSVSETDEVNWKCISNTRKGNDEDLISTADSDTFGKLTNREDYKRKPRYSYSFTPKSEMDLNLEDLVKFARPGGKMSTGRVCFVGHLPGRREVCVGLELDEDAGKHDGIFEGTRYFQCKKNRGVFISFHKIILAYKSI